MSHSLKPLFIFSFGIFFLAACSQNFNCTFDKTFMPSNTYTGCNVNLIPTDHWATLEKDGEEYGRYYRKEGQIFWKAKVDRKLENIDPGTFAVSAKYVDFAQDKNGFYFFGEPMKVDPDTFQVLSNTHSKDKNGVYYGVHTMEDADPKTFEVINYVIYSQTPYSKDKTHVYYQWMKIEDADIETFEILDDSGHSKDKSWFYLYDKREKAVQL